MRMIRAFFVLILIFAGTGAWCQEKTVESVQSIKIRNTNLDQSITFTSIVFPGTSHFYVGKPFEGSLVFLTGMAGELAVALGTYYVVEGYSQTETGVNGNTYPNYVSLNTTSSANLRNLGLGIVAGGAIVWGLSVIFDIVDSKDYLLTKKAELEQERK